MASKKKDQIVIEMSIEGFTEEAITNLKAMVAAKAPLIKMAVGAKSLPIKVNEEKISFPWFVTDDPALAECYAQFIAQLCKTAKTKKRVTAKEREDGWTNPRFNFRVFLISLGCVGSEFKAVRRALCAHLPGNAAWSSGIDPRRKTTPETASAVEASAEPESPAMET